MKEMNISETDVFLRTIRRLILIAKVLDIFRPIKRASVLSVKRCVNW